MFTTPFHVLFYCFVYLHRLDSNGVTANMSVPRYGFGMTTLADGTVLAAGGTVASSLWTLGIGSSNTYTALTEVYFVHNDSWVTAAPLAMARGSTAVTGLPSGAALIVGG